MGKNLFLINRPCSFQINVHSLYERIHYNRNSTYFKDGLDFAVFATLVLLNVGLA